MKTITFIFLVALSFSGLIAQDGSDINYIDEANIDSTLVNRFVQIDFFDNSFGSNKFADDKAEPIEIIFENKNWKFLEVRNDDGFNNWFGEQYLESIEKIAGKKLRIEKMKILEIGASFVKVNLFSRSYNDDGQTEQVVFLHQQTTFQRKHIYQLLVDAKPPIRQGLAMYQIHLDLKAKPESECKYCFEPIIDYLFRSPILSEYHIQEFDYENQNVDLTKVGNRIIQKLDIPLAGLPVVLTLNGDIIYGFWFWNVYSSIGCDRVYTYPKLGFHLEFGLPEDYAFGADPRFDKRLEEYLQSTD